MQLLQAHFLSPLSHPCRRLRTVQGRQLPPLGCLQGSGVAGPERAGAGLPLLERAEIATIAVDPLFQGKNIGREMMQYLEKLARDNGCETISLEVRASNERAKNLYQSCGFIFVNLKPSYYKTKEGFEDGLFLMKGI